MTLFDPLDPDRLPEKDGSLVGFWLGGILAPLPLLVFGFRCIVTRSAILLLGRVRSPYPLLLEGTEAIACGGFLLVLAALLHVHFFWGARASEKSEQKVQIAKALLLLALILFTLSIAWAIVRRFFEFP
jgi:hypothetical protein